MLIGITGTDGAGKGLVVSYLVNKQNFVHFSSRDWLQTEVEKRGLISTRQNLRLVANDLRAQEGDDVVVRQALQRIEENKVTNAVIESIRTTKEVETLKQAGGILLAVDAEQSIRYERIVGRASETDKISLAEFIKHETLEMNDPDPHGMQKAAVIALADYTIMNNGSIGELNQAIEDFLEPLIWEKNRILLTPTMIPKDNLLFLNPDLIFNDRREYKNGNTLVVDLPPTF